MAGDSVKAQTVLLLHGPRQAYQITNDYDVPLLVEDDETLVKTHTIGLNPIDWKAPDYNFGIASLPYIAGRELAGRVTTTPRKNSRLKEGDRVLVISTDYRDLRKAAYQEYVVSSDFNVARIPPSISFQQAAGLGVAFSAAAITLGICMGVDFSSVAGGPDLLELVRSVDSESIPVDVRTECLQGITDDERAISGDWVAVWGGSSTSANITVQLARLVGLKVITIVDTAKHGLRISGCSAQRPDLLIDSHDTSRAVDIINSSVGSQLRFALDTRGRDSATILLEALTRQKRLADAPPSPPDTPREYKRQTSHLVGLTGLPKEAAPEGIAYHTVPIKIFHSVPSVGEALVLWLERLLEQGLIQPPPVIGVESGFDGVNKGLDRMRAGEISGGRLVVDLVA
ncbi:alcohol dehydrogenase -like domain-containing [Trichoderma arundinaceum]|uniref:Alcohol dehydrogenase-like domain-containing n=1 Tax=Trichoderma arundinaceum TaxID=490622 RepID=A0A395NE25_TRIAR|nr:alcohol dehydrogenase -like domain-containing [Trichoderma arundinaceum]